MKALLMKWIAPVIMAVAACTCAMPALSADELKVVRAEIDSNSVDRTHKCQYYKAWYNEQCTKAELDAMLERNIAAHRRWIELDPKSFYPYVSLGKTLAAVGRWDEARPVLEKAVSASGTPRPSPRQTENRWFTTWLSGSLDRSACIVAERFRICYNSQT